ncbi:hypothetical protein J7E70_30240 [Variovorax paradoxus]|nr:hypothetical protein [Variovorax paradoxus]MBT2304702.1 hypothetical protein [Variovorax paradoxus]
MTIDVERLGVLLDRGEDVQTAARQARSDLQEAERALRQHTGDDTARSALASRVDRRRAAHDALARRSHVWLEYCTTLRTCAQKYGVTDL